jgi:hypothetical protein
MGQVDEAGARRINHGALPRQSPHPLTKAGRAREELKSARSRNKYLLSHPRRASRTFQPRQSHIVIPLARIAKLIRQANARHIEIDRANMQLYTRGYIVTN